MAPTQPEPIPVILLPCPFCGSHDITLDQLGDEERPFFVMTCRDCQADGPIEATEAEAIEAWNIRVQPDGDGNA